MNASLLFAQSQSHGILDRIDSGALSVVAILGVIGCFVLAIVLVGCIATTIQRVIAIRESNRLILELLNRGYSAEEIERVAYGNAKFSRKVGRFFRHTRNMFRPKEKQAAVAVAPVKTAEHRASV